ncbi:hypothetical protein D3C87_2045940 [compost metagenome]
MWLAENVMYAALAGFAILELLIATEVIHRLSADIGRTGGRSDSRSSDYCDDDEFAHFAPPQGLARNTRPLVAPTPPIGRTRVRRH